MKSDISGVLRRVAIWILSLVLIGVGTLSLLGALLGNGAGPTGNAVLLLTSVAAFGIVLTNLSRK